MPIIIADIEQRTEEWFSAIAGNVGASSIDKIITSTGQKSKQRDDYMYALAAERITGRLDGMQPTQAMLTGIEREAEARNFFQLMTGLDVQEVGLIYKDENKLCHCSPDGIIGTNAGLEIKCPAAKTQAKYLHANKLPTEYYCQVQFSLYVSERDTWHFVSYYPAMRPLLLECHRDEEWIKKMEAELDSFNNDVARLVEVIR
jgi:putative phage-type endonuclease